MSRALTDVTIGLAAGLLIASLAGGAYALAARADCYDAQVAASAWTSSNTDPTMPAALVPTCDAWESLLKALVPTALGAIVATSGLIAIRSQAAGKPTRTS